MLFDEAQELPDLVGFRFSSDFLEVYQFRDARMSKNMVAPSGALQGKPKALY